MNRPRPVRTFDRPGIGVDAQGGAVIDPTANVFALVDAERHRADDLRVAAEKLSDAKHQNARDIGALRAAHAAELRKGDALVDDSIRRIDRDQADKTAAQAQEAIKALAQVTSTTAEALRNQVASTAAAAAQQSAIQFGEINKRLSALELSSSEGKGKQSYADPQIADLKKVVEDLARSQQAGSGFKAGQAAVIAGIVAFFSLIGSVVYIVAELKPAPAPQVTYTAPATAK